MTKGAFRKNSFRDFIQTWLFLAVAPAASSIGLKMSAAQGQIWQQEISRGKWDFIIRRGCSIGVFCAILYWIEYLVQIPEKDWDFQQLLMFGIFFVIIGIVWGICTWHVLNKYFSQTA